MPKRAAKFRPPWYGAKKDERPSSHRRGYGGKNWASTRMQVIVRDCSTCQSCGRVCTGRDCHVDHIIPKKAGGTDAIENLQILCQQCHQSKTAAGL